MNESEQQRLRSQSAFASQEGKRWCEDKRAESAVLQTGTVVALNVINGSYVTAASDIEAMDRFQQTFGKGTTLAYVFEVGRPVFIGGGYASNDIYGI
jgi:hypothetical protein